MTWYHITCILKTVLSLDILTTQSAITPFKHSAMTCIQKHTEEFKVLCRLYVHFVNASLSDCRRHRFDRRLNKVDELWEVSCGWGMLFLLRQYKPRQSDGLGIDGVSSAHLVLLAMKLNRCQRQCARLRVIS